MGESKEGGRGSSGWERVKRVSAGMVGGQEDYHVGKAGISKENMLRARWVY